MARSKLVERVKILRDKQGLGTHEAQEVAVGERLLVQLKEAQTFQQLRNVLATLVVHQFKTGRSKDKFGKILEESIRTGSSFLDARVDQLEKDTSPHRQY